MGSGIGMVLHRGGFRSEAHNGIRPALSSSAGAGAAAVLVMFRASFYKGVFGVPGGYAAAGQHDRAMGAGGNA